MSDGGSQKLLTDMKWTEGSRFIAAARLRRNYRSRQWLMVIFSIVVVSISAVTLVFPIPEPYPKIFGFLALIASIFIVVFSATQIESDDTVRAHLLYNSAVDISNMRRTWSLQLSQHNDEVLSQYASDYGDLLSSYGVNHEDRDFASYKRSHKWEFQDLNDESKTLSAAKGLLQIFTDSLPISASITAAAAAIGALLSLALASLTP